MKKLTVALMLALSLLFCSALADPTPSLQGGGTKATAAVLTDGQLVLSELVDADDVTQLQYFAFTSVDGGQYTACIVENLGSTGNSEGFRLRLLDKDGAELYKSAVKSGSQVTLSAKIPAGETVYAEIYGYYEAINGKFRIQFRTIPDAEGDDGVPLVSGEVHTIDVNHDEDVFTWQTGEHVTYMDVLATNISCHGDWYYAVYDGYNVRVHDQRVYGASGTGSATLRLEPQTLYTFRVYTGKCTGNYRLDVTVAEDLYGDAADQATALATGQTVSAALQSKNDRDYFLLESQDTQSYHCLTLANATADYRLTVNVYDVYQQQVAKFSTDIGKTNTVKFKLPAAGQYYVAVTGDRGQYALTHTLISDNEGDTTAAAAAIATGTAAQYAIESANDVDYFVLAAAEAERMIGVSLDSALDDQRVYITAYDQHERVLMDTRADGKRISFTVQQTAGEALYIRVTGEKAARYVLQLCSPDAHTASAEWTVITEPTCTEGGQQDKLCAICSSAVVTQELPALEHVCGDWKTDTKATCTQAGLEAASCTRCREKAFSREIPMLAHEAGNWKTVSKATCTEDGLNEQRCKDCGILLDSEVLAATGHKSGEPKVVKSTCSNAGSSTVSCTECKVALSTEELPLSAHTAGNWKQVSRPTCTEAGRNEQYCIMCNALLASEDIPAYGHKSSYAKTTNATCATAGKTEQYCTECNVLLVSTEIPATGHRQGVWRDTVSATCTADGERTEYCADCNAALSTEVVPAHGHSAAEWQQVQSASCLAKGLREQRCSTCDAVLASEEADALGHSYTEWEITIEATKEIEGEQRRHCIHCGDTQFEAIPKIEKLFGIF